MKEDAYEKGIKDGRHGKYRNPYHPAANDCQDYKAGYERGSKEKKNSEVNDQLTNKSLDSDP